MPVEIPVDDKLVVNNAVSATQPMPETKPVLAPWIVAPSDITKPNPASEALRIPEEPIVVDDIYDACDLAVFKLCDILEKAYGKEGVNPLDYHISQHSQDVASGVETDLRAISQIEPGAVKEEDILKMALITWGHDLILRSYLVGGNGSRMRLRGAMPGALGQNDRLADLTKESDLALLDVTDVASTEANANERIEVSGGNELSSAQMLYHVLNSYVYPNGEKVFDYTLDELVELVAVTYPDFAMEEVGGVKAVKVTQPYLTPAATLPELVLALRDLKGYSGVSSSEVFMATSDAEFRELYNFRGTDDTRSAEDLMRAGLEWARIAGGFVRHQMADFTRIMETNNYLAEHPSIRAYLERTYKVENFAANAAACDERYVTLVEKYGELDNLDTALFEQFLEEFGF